MSDTGPVRRRLGSPADDLEDARPRWDAGQDHPPTGVPQLLQCAADHRLGQSPTESLDHVALAPLAVPTPAVMLQEGQGEGEGPRVKRPGRALHCGEGLTASASAFCDSYKIPLASRSVNQPIPREPSHSFTPYCLPILLSSNSLVFQSF